LKPLLPSFRLPELKIESRLDSGLISMVEV
jgi:hypothetical protein